MYLSKDILVASAFGNYKHLLLQMFTFKFLPDHSFQITCDSAFSLQNVQPKEMGEYVHCMCENVHSSIIINNRTLKTTVSQWNGSIILGVFHKGILNIPLKDCYIPCHGWQLSQTWCAWPERVHTLWLYLQKVQQKTKLFLCVIDIRIVVTFLQRMSSVAPE